MTGFGTKAPHRSGRGSSKSKDGPPGMAESSHFKFHMLSRVSDWEGDYFKGNEDVELPAMVFGRKVRNRCYSDCSENMAKVMHREGKLPQISVRIFSKVD